VFKGAFLCLAWYRPQLSDLWMGVCQVTSYCHPTLQTNEPRLLTMSLIFAGCRHSPSGITTCYKGPRPLFLHSPAA
jgi:hypothetical protein